MGQGEENRVKKSDEVARKMKENEEREGGEDILLNGNIHNARIIKAR